jgi:hypothetical protein
MDAAIDDKRILEKDRGLVARAGLGGAAGAVQDELGAAAVAGGARAERVREAVEPVKLTLPWLHPGGTPTTVRVYLVDYDGRPLRRGAFNSQVWRPALVKAGVTGLTRDHGMHALRHLYASVLLDAGESVKALAQ